MAKITKASQKPPSAAQATQTLTIMGFCTGMTFLACKWFEAPVLESWSYWWVMVLFSAPFLVALSVFLLLAIPVLVSQWLRAMFLYPVHLVSTLKKTSKKVYKAPRVRKLTAEQKAAFQNLVNNPGPPSKKPTPTGQSKEQLLREAQLETLANELAALKAKFPDQYIDSKALTPELKDPEPARPKQDDPSEEESVSETPVTAAHASASKALKEMTISERKKLYEMNEKNNRRVLDRLEGSDKV